ncbi:MAG TPA: signal recognition particle-docking protein FtsY [Methylophilaceae bacterium]|nr:signal recognition particle-docking protein FtsY [Methylophilaceae bacterium]
MFDYFKKNKTPETEQKTQKNQPAQVQENKPSFSSPTVEGDKLSLAERLKRGLSKTRQHLGGQLSGLFSGGKIDEDTYEELESILLTSDIGVAATQKLLDALKLRLKKERLEDTSALKEALKTELLSILTPLEAPLETNKHRPFVIMLAGVNGAGKTTSIGKLAKLFQAQGSSVLIAAGDTFRAAAREQLQVWGERNNVHVVASEGADAAAVIFDAVNSAIAKKIDILIADTAGRLPTQMHLMDEITKVKRVINKALAGAPHEVMLVLDANTGQNAVSQVKAFDDALSVTGLILSKLDGSAKGGVIAAIAEERPIPIRFVGVGEGIDDLRPFKANDFVNALFDS